MASFLATGMYVLLVLVSLAILAIGAVAVFVLWMVWTTERRPRHATYGDRIDPGTLIEDIEHYLREEAHGDYDH